MPTALITGVNCPDGSYLADRNRFVDDVKRVMRPDGLWVVEMSCPHLGSSSMTAAMFVMNTWSITLGIRLSTYSSFMSLGW
jgi:hypothetical protein